MPVDFHITATVRAPRQFGGVVSTSTAPSGSSTAVAPQVVSNAPSGSSPAVTPQVISNAPSGSSAAITPQVVSVVPPQNLPQNPPQ